MELEIAQIVVPNNRRLLKDIHQLADSIKDIGLLNPITVMNTNISTDTFTSTATLDTFRLVTGFHRLEACKALNRSEGIKRYTNQKGLTEGHMTEIFQLQVDLYFRLATHLHRPGWTVKEIGEVINTAKSNVSNICSEFPGMEKQNESLLNSYLPFLGVAGQFDLPVISTNIKNYIEQQLLDEGHLREITSISNVQYLSPWLTTHQVWNKNRVAEGNLSEMVSLRLKLHAMPERVKNFANQGELTETHLIQISQLQIDLHPWLTTHQACNKNGVATGDLSEGHLDALPGIVAPSQLSFRVSSEAVRENIARIVTLDKFPCKSLINCTNLPIVNYSKAAKGWQLPAGPYGIDTMNACAASGGQGR